MYTIAIFCLSFSCEKYKFEYNIASEIKNHSINLKPLIFPRKLDTWGFFVCLFYGDRMHLHGSIVTLSLETSLWAWILVPCTWVTRRFTALSVSSQSQCLFKSAPTGLYHIITRCLSRSVMIWWLRVCNLIQGLTLAGHKLLSKW